MTSFKDSNGNTLVVQMTIGTAMRIKAKHGIDLLKIEENGELEAFSKMTVDLEKQAYVIFEMLGIEEENAETFLSKLDGQTMGEMQRAFFEELADFFLKSGQLAKAKIVRKNKQILETANQFAADQVDKLAEKALSEVISCGGTHGNAPAD